MRNMKNLIWRALRVAAIAAVFCAVWTGCNDLGVGGNSDKNGEADAFLKWLNPPASNPPASGGNLVLGANEAWMFTENGETYGIIFKSNKDFVFIYYDMEEGWFGGVAGTWSTNGVNITLTVDGEAETGTYSVSGNSLTITIDGEATIFTKTNNITYTNIILSNIAMVYVPGGTFTMGCTSEQGNDCTTSESPTHSVTLSSFYIGETEITQGEWKAVMGGSNPSYYKGDNLPVTSISWNEVQTFITALNNATGKKYRLPTEAEWEYAARGGRSSNKYKYSGSNNINDVAWYEGNSNNTTHPVGTKTPNELGIYDMSGNVFEWVNDRYGSYSSFAVTNPTGPTSGLFRITRGGSNSENTGALYCRVSSRLWNDPNDKYSDVGFRLALNP